MQTGLAGRAVLVTGASSGIGRAVAVAFADEGARVVVADVDAAGGADTVAAARAAGAEAVFVTADVTRASDTEAMVGAAIDAFGGLDVAVNNAGTTGATAPVAEHDAADWDRTLALNLTGVFLSMKYELPALLDRGGAIVNVASAAGLVGFPGLPAYVASKHGVIGLTRAAALEYVKAGVRVNAVCPGSIRTPMLDGYLASDPKAEKRMLAGQPSGRLGTPEEIAAAVVWLCSDAASYLVGHALVADGGATVQ